MNDLAIVALGLFVAWIGTLAVLAVTLYRYGKLAESVQRFSEKQAFIALKYREGAPRPPDRQFQRKIGRDELGPEQRRYMSVGETRDAKIMLRSHAKRGEAYARKGLLSYTRRGDLIYWSDGSMERVDGKPMVEDLYPRPADPQPREEKEPSSG